jgi:Arc/MetJ-type ribon-helix-helix transcriptional regulator
LIVGRKKAVVSADPAVLAAVEAYVRDGTYSSVSEFVREAMAEQLTRVRQARLSEQVARYVAGRHDDDRDADLIAAQAVPDQEDS